MKIPVVKGATSVRIWIFIADSSSTTGAGLTGLTSGSAGLVCYRARDDDGNAGGTAISLSGGTRGTWSSGGFVEKDSANMPGWYELGVPNAAIVTGSRTCELNLKGATNMVPLPIELLLGGTDDQAATVPADIQTIKTQAVTCSAGVTVNPNVGTTQPINFTGTGASALAKIDAIDWNSVAVTGMPMPTYTQPSGFLAATFPTNVASPSGVWQDTTAGDFTVPNSIGKSLFTSGNAPGAASGLALVGSNMGSAASVTAGVTVTTNNDKTGYTLTVTPPTAAAIATSVLTTQMTESYRAAGIAPTLAQTQFELIAQVGDSGIAGTTKTLRTLAGGTAKTFTLDSATVPTSITETT